MRDYEIIIVGAGPSGCASAIQLSNLDPDLAGHVLLLDRAVFPRFKLCAGGISSDADLALQQLGVNVDVPSVPVNVTRFVLPTGYLTFQKPSQFRVIRRDQFDHYLFQIARQRGVETKDGEGLETIINSSDGVIVQTAKDEYRAKILIAADGANSKVRAGLRMTRARRVMVAMETHVPYGDVSISNFTDNMAVLDLSPLNHNVPGYCWIFPTVNNGPSIVSMGIMAAPFGSGESSSFKAVFDAWLNNLGVDSHDLELKAHPALRYEPRAASSQGRVLFVGDAAGVEPLFGEGISSALASGIIAAESAFDAIITKDFSFSDYEERIRCSWIGSMMRRRRMIARRLYSKPRLARFYLRHGALLRGLMLLHAQRLGAKLTWEASSAGAVSK